MNALLSRHSFIYLFLLSIYFYFFMVVDTPIILADEGGYIGSARYFATGKGLIDLRANIYYPGISLLYAPIFLIIDNLNVAYKCIQFINLLLASFIPVMTFKILNEIYSKSINNKALFVVSGMSFIYSTVFCYINLAISEILLTLLFLNILYLLLKLESEIKTKYIIALTISSALLFLSHPRAVVVLIALLFFSIFFLLKNKGIFFFYLCSIIFVFALDKYFVSQLVESYLSIVLDESSTNEATDEFTIKIILKIFSSWNNFASLIVGIVGQIWYLTIASFGLIWVSLIKISENILSNNKRYTFLFLLLSAAGMLLLSSLFMNGHDRGDHYIYGRYNEFIWLILLSMGMYSFLTDKFSTKFVWLLLVFICTLLNIYAFYQADKLQGLVFNHNNILGIYLYSCLFKTYNIYYISFLSSFLICAMFLLKKISNASIFILISYIVLNNYMIVHVYYKRNSNGRMHEHEVSKFINNNILDDIVVAYDRKAWSGWHYFNYQLYSPNIQMYRFNSDNINQHEFEYVISGLFNLGKNYRIIALENHHKQTLFISKNNKYYEKFLLAGFVLPSNFPSALPIEAYKYKFRNIKIDTNTVSMSLQHLGARTFWPNLYAVKQPKYSVRVGIQYLNSKFEKLSEERKELSRSIYPNEVEELTINLPQQCKTDFVKIDMLQELVAWFEPYGNAPLLLSCDNGVYTIDSIKNNI